MAKLGPKHLRIRYGKLVKELNEAIDEQFQAKEEGADFLSDRMTRLFDKEEAILVKVEGAEDDLFEAGATHIQSPENAIRFYEKNKGE